MPSRWLASVALCIVPLALLAQQPSNASGTMTVNGVTAPLHHAYAVHDASIDFTRVFLTSKPLTAAMLAEEVELRDSGGESALRALVRKGEASALELFVGTDGTMQTVMVFARGFDAPTPCTGDRSYWYEPYRMEEGWIGGRSRSREPQEFFDTRWEYDVSYFAPVGKAAFEIASGGAIAAQKKNVDARETGRIVPPGGGEEGAVYLAFFRHLESGNVRAALDQMTPPMVRSLAEQMDVRELTPSDLALWAMSLTTPPGKVEVVGGVRDAEATLLELRRTNGSRVRFGTATMVRIGAGWKLDRQEW